MGILMRLPATDNHIGIDLEDAYWSIDNITIANYSGVSYVMFEFNTYASRNAKHLANTTVPNTNIGFGGSERVTYSPILHKFETSFASSAVFPNGIPITEAGQKDLLYTYLKEYLSLSNYTDVFE